MLRRRRLDRETENDPSKLIERVATRSLERRL